MLIDGKNMMKCKTCDGKKKICTLGCLKKICPNCDGKGWVEAEDEAPILDGTLTIKNVDGTTTEVKPIKPWTPEDLPQKPKKKSKSQQRRLKLQKPKKRRKAKK